MHGKLVCGKERKEHSFFRILETFKSAMYGGHMHHLCYLLAFICRTFKSKSRPNIEFVLLLAGSHEPISNFRLYVLCWMEFEHHP